MAEPSSVPEPKKDPRERFVASPDDFVFGDEAAPSPTPEPESEPEAE